MTETLTIPNEAIDQGPIVSRSGVTPEGQQVTFTEINGYGHGGRPFHASMLEVELASPQKNWPGLAKIIDQNFHVHFIHFYKDPDQPEAVKVYDPNSLTEPATPQSIEQSRKEFIRLLADSSWKTN